MHYLLLLPTLFTRLEFWLFPKVSFFVKKNFFLVDSFNNWKRKWQPTPVFLPGKSNGRGAWRATVHGIEKESDKT